MSQVRGGPRAKALALLGTGSDVGKSVLCAGLCRLLHRAGRRVVPFKAQNMSLNSFVTPEGGEIGRAQALQAEACGIPAHVDMNPILLKPESDTCAQVVVHGKPTTKLEAAAYFRSGLPLFEKVRESYERLARQYEVMVIEGAGSAAEVNLRARDIVNWPVVALANAQVVLVADIDRGGVFAQVLGTLNLLQEDERRRVKGIIINKFRGDRSLFDDGVAFLEAQSGIPVLGVVPFLRPLRLDQEDALERDPNGSGGRFDPQRVNIAVVLLPHMSNFTDFNPLLHESDVALQYSETPRQLGEADVIILPGTKNTLADLEHLKRAGFVEAIEGQVRRGKELVGICGGYQMLGRAVADPFGVEAGGEAAGLAFLEVETVLRPYKITNLVEGIALHVESMTAPEVRGYCIHMGETSRSRHPPAFHLTNITGQDGIGGLQRADFNDSYDGAVREDRLVWGTYIHGLFDEPGFRRGWLNRARHRKGLPSLDVALSQAATARQYQELDRWADHVQQYVGLDTVWAALK